MHSSLQTRSSRGPTTSICSSRGRASAAIAAVGAVLLCGSQAQAQTVDACEIIRDADGFPVVLAAVEGLGEETLAATIEFAGANGTPLAARFFRLSEDHSVFAWHPIVDDDSINKLFRSPSTVSVTTGNDSARCESRMFTRAGAWTKGDKIVINGGDKATEACVDCARQLACEVLPRTFAYEMKAKLCKVPTYTVDMWVVGSSFYDSHDEPSDGPFAFTHLPPFLRCMVIRATTTNGAAFLVKAKFPINTSRFDFSSPLSFVPLPATPHHQVLTLQAATNIPEMYFYLLHIAAGHLVDLTQGFGEVTLTVNNAVTAECHFKYYLDGILDANLPDALPFLDEASHYDPGMLESTGGYSGCPNCIEQFVCSVMDTIYEEPTLPATCPSSMPYSSQAVDPHFAEQVEQLIDFHPHFP